MVHPPEYYSRAFLEAVSPNLLHERFGPPRVSKMGRIKRVLVGLFGRRHTVVNKDTGWVSNCIDYRGKTYILSCYPLRYVQWKRWGQK